MGLLACGDNASPQRLPEPPPPTPIAFSHQGLTGLVVERLYLQYDKVQKHLYGTGIGALAYSDNLGMSWRRLQYPGGRGLYGGVRSMLLVQRQQQTYLYLGLLKGGVMEVKVQ